MRVNRCVREPRLLLVVQEGLGLGLFVLDLLSYPLLHKYASAAPASQTKTYHFSTQSLHSAVSLFNPVLLLRNTRPGIKDYARVT